MEWSDELIARLRGLWDEGHSTAEIGRRLGVSKNAIIGKAHRLALPGRPSPIRPERPDGLKRRRSAPRRVVGPTLPPLAGDTVLVESAPRALARRDPGSSPGQAPGVGWPQRSAQPQRRLSPPQEPGAAGSREIAAPRPAPAENRGYAATYRPGARQLPCCWPIGEPGTPSFRFCDAVALPGKPYCDEHAQVAYVRVRDRREEAA